VCKCALPPGVNPIAVIHIYIYIYIYTRIYIHIYISCEPGSSVGIATDYGLDDPRLIPGGGEIFRAPPDRPWGPPSPVQWVPGLSRG
jgi:hypothetical protein